MIGYSTGWSIGIEGRRVRKLGECCIGAICRKIGPFFVIPRKLSRASSFICRFSRRGIAPSSCRMVCAGRRQGGRGMEVPGNRSHRQYPASTEDLQSPLRRSIRGHDRKVCHRSNSEALPAESFPMQHSPCFRFDSIARVTLPIINVAFGGKSNRKQASAVQSEQVRESAHDGNNGSL